MGQGTASHDAALDMLKAFGSVGATKFDVTWTNETGGPALFRRDRSLTELMRSMPAMLDQAVADRRNLIVRPYGPPAVFLQLDDLAAVALDRVRPAAFLILDTSPGNHQAWVALAGMPDDEEFARRLRKGAGADATASGATRVAGSINFKPKYAPDYPQVQIGHIDAGRITTAANLEAMGLVAPLEPVTPARVANAARWQSSGRKWPSYERELARAPASESQPGKTRGSIADFNWCVIASDWGWKVEEIAGRLMEESQKAKENGQRYAVLTATKASELVSKREKRPIHKPKY